MALTLLDERRAPLMEMVVRWQIRYSRCFGYHPPTFTSSSLSPLKRNIHGNWLSSASPTAIVSLSADHSVSDFILTVYFDGKILEQHYASKLNFSWPQLSCTSDVPQQSTRVVFVSYTDGASETQKFGLCFSSYYEVREFVTMLEDSFSNKQQYLENMMTTHSSQSEGKNASSEVIPNGASQILDTRVNTSYLTSTQQSHSSEGYIPSISECYVPHISEDCSPVFPPRFTSLVTNCSEMAQPQGDVAPSTPRATQEIDLQSLIVKYLQDGSFLDILTKAEEVIAQMGGGMAIQHFSSS